MRQQCGKLGKTCYAKKVRHRDVDKLMKLDELDKSAQLSWGKYVYITSKIYQNKPF